MLWGYGAASASVELELWKPELFFGSLSPAQLPEGRWRHTQTGLTACGGEVSVAIMRRRFLEKIPHFGSSEIPSLCMGDR